MKNIRSVVRCLNGAALAGLLALAVSNASADIVYGGTTAAVNPPGSSGNQLYAWSVAPYPSYTIGSQFEWTGADQTLVTRLGWWDYDYNGEGNDLNTPHNVTLWTLAGADPLVEVVVPVDAPMDPDGYRWVDVSSPVYLQTGAVYVLGGLMTPWDPEVSWNNDFHSYTYEIGSGFSLIQNLGNDDAVPPVQGWAKPVGNWGSWPGVGRLVVGPNITVVPEPATTGVMVGLLAGGLLVRRRNRG